MSTPSRIQPAKRASAESHDRPMAESKIITGAKEAIAYARGRPVEGTRETWFSDFDMKWHSRTFKDGKWVDDPAKG